MLPDEENPVLVYRGVEDGGKVAVFELTGAVVAAGRRQVRARRPRTASTCKLRAGETEFITVTDTGEETDAQYQLDLVKINKKPTKVHGRRLAQSERWPRPSSLKLKAARAAQAQPLRLRRDDGHAAPSRSKTPTRRRSKPTRREPMKRARRALGSAAARSGAS